MNDLISRQVAMNEVKKWFFNFKDKRTFGEVLRDIPSAQSEQTKMIKEIREWINSGHRGYADYFIVDKIEEIINKYE